MSEILIATAVRELLESRLLEQADLVAAIHQARQIPDAQGPPGHFRCRCRLAVPRPRDPETATLRELEVRLRETDEGLEVYAVAGLDPAE